MSNFIPHPQKRRAKRESGIVREYFEHVQEHGNSLIRFKMESRSQMETRSQSRSKLLPSNSSVDDDSEKAMDEAELMYARFTAEIVSGKEFPAGEFDLAKTEDDPEYELPPTPSPDIVEGENAVRSPESGIVDDGEHSESSGSDDDDDEGEEEDPLDPTRKPMPDVPIPGVALVEAKKRFPPFWRTKNRLATVEASSYKSEEDPNFAPTEAELELSAISSDESGEEEEEGDEEGRVQEEDFDISEEEVAALSATALDDADDLTAVMEVLNIGDEVDKLDGDEMESESTEEEEGMGQ